MHDMREQLNALRTAHADCPATEEKLRAELLRCQDEAEELKRQLAASADRVKAATDREIALGSPVSLDYRNKAPFKFNGTIARMHVKYAPPKAMQERT